MRLGLVGSGQTVDPYARRFAKLSGVDIVATRGTRPSADRSTVERFDDTESMFDAVHLDAVCLSTTPDRHRTVISDAIERGIAVFCPGPLAGTIDDGEAIVDAVTSSDTVFVGGYGTQLAPEYNRAASRIDEGTIGRVGNVRTTREVPAARTLGGEYAVLGTDVEFLRGVCGPVERVFARRTSTDDDCYLVATLRFQNAIVGQLDVRVHGAREVPAGDGLRWNAGIRRFELAGSDGLLEFDSETVAPVVVDTDAVQRRDVPLARDGIRRQSEAFVECVTGDREPVCPVEDAYETLRVCTAARVSADAGVPVTPVEVGG